MNKNQVQVAEDQHTSMEGSLARFYDEWNGKS